MINDLIPKISCVLVTTGRIEMVRKAIDCFVSQTYKLKELVVVSQGTDEQNAQIKNMASFEGCIFIEAPQRLSLGAMRNLSVELSTGPIICQWDDDDYYHPNRLTTQYKHLRGNAVASLYTQHLKLFKERGVMYWVDYKRGTDDYLQVIKNSPYKRFLTGSVMFRKDCFYEYKNFLYPESGDQSDREEDLNVLQKLMRLGRVEEVNAGYQYVYVYHGNNTYELKHHEMGLHKKHLFTRDEIEFQKEFLFQCFDDMKIQGFEFCTSSIVDFDDPNHSLGREIVFAV